MPLRVLFAVLLAGLLTGCSGGAPHEWVRCTENHPATGRCTAWLIGPPNFGKQQ